VSEAAPVGKPLTLVALKPKPVLLDAADAVPESRRTAAASTAGTSAMTLIFIFEVLSSCRWISVAYSPGVGSVSVAFLHRKDRVGDQAVRLLVHPCGRPRRRARRPGSSDRAAL
jgi:hypothetical protein